MVNWFGGIIFGIFLLFLAFYRNRPKWSNNCFSPVKRKMWSILSKIIDFPKTCTIFIKKWLKFTISALLPKVDRKKTRIRTFLKPISKRSKNLNFENFNRLNSKSNNDDENTEKSRSGKKGKIFLNYKN